MGGEVTQNSLDFVVLKTCYSVGSIFPFIIQHYGKRKLDFAKKCLIVPFQNSSLHRNDLDFFDTLEI